ncbi:Uroporphyrinogen-III C-methyltransferase [Rosistilla oblonga]|uniref:uroporphyrinogen-III C-methyltransferase n=2 Tax=Rosistilla oblonga TaxID=2527990 RepID=A0A518IQ14_9BACT|nr:Uroporphyrinogen-III C-methyltransferase [Rosistilla oblonga]
MSSPKSPFHPNERPIHSATRMLGHVYLIGAGPGDPQLITLRGVQCLKKADIVLYDGLVNPQLLAHAAADAELVCVGKHGQQRIWTQDEIQVELLRLAGEGRIVARLKGGDPAVFARGAEEAAALSQAGIPFEVVPGITAALAAGSFAGIPITHRHHASAVALVTGHQQDNDATDLDWNALAKFPGTLVIYMGVTTAHIWSKALIDGGKATDTPVAIVRRCTWSDQQIFRCTLAEVADRLSPANKIRPPAIVIVGPVADLPDQLDWFQRRPLVGQRVLVTRPSGQADALGEALKELGAEPLYQPAVEIAPPADFADVDESIARLAEFDWIVFSSRNGVQYYLDRILELGRDMRLLGRCQIAAVGDRTAEALRRYGLLADLVPEDFEAASLAASMAPQAAGKQILSIRASRGRDVLRQQLVDAGASVRDVVAYQNRDVIQADAKIGQRMADGEIDWTTVTSSAIARSLVQMFGDSLHRTKLASLSPITTQTLQGLGFSVACEAKQYTMDGLVEAIHQAGD